MFEQYTDQAMSNSIQLPERDRPHPCPCYGYLTLAERGMYSICPVCFWEDDGQDDRDAQLVHKGGPNGNLGLAQARRNFAAYGANRKRDLPHVREPHPREHPLYEHD